MKTLLFELSQPAILDVGERLIELRGLKLKQAESTVITFHYTHSIPSGKSHWLAFGSAIIVWSLPANKNLGQFLLGEPCEVWELSRLWAPDGHEKNLLTRAISHAVKWICQNEQPDVLVSYADPSAGHAGVVYKAASWIYHGRSDENRAYESADGNRVARRAFHSGSVGMTKGQIQASGFTEVRLPGKHRYVKPVSKKARLRMETLDSPAPKA